MIRLDKQIFQTKVVYFNLVKYYIFVVPSFDSNVQFVHFTAKGERARVYSPPFFFIL